MKNFLLLIIGFVIILISLIGIFAVFGMISNIESRNFLTSADFPDLIVTFFAGLIVLIIFSLGWGIIFNRFKL